MDLKIYYTSDVHGYLLPTDYSDSEIKPIGLLSASEQFERDENTLLIDGGDMFQGSPFVNYFQKKEQRATGVIEAINQIGYDVVTLGNHDFNYGFERLAQELNDLQATVTCVNILDQQGHLLFPELIKVMPNGLKVGIVGITTEYINVWEKPEHLKEIQIVNPFQAAKEALERLEGQVDFSICLYHGGFEIDIDSKELISKTKENIGYQLAKNLSFDLLLTGHQHQTIEGQDLEGTFIVQPTNMARNFFEIEVETSKKEIKANLLEPTGYFNTEKFDNYVSMNAEVEEYLDQAIGELPEAIVSKDHLALAQTGNEWIRLIANVEQRIAQTDIAIVSSFNSLYPMNKELSIRDVLVNYPYENLLCKVELTGKQLKEMMEKTATYFVKENEKIIINPTWLSPKLEHYNYDFYYGLDYVMDIGQPVGKRITRLNLKGKPIEEDQVVSIALNDYRASGGGEYIAYQEALLNDNLGVDIQQLLIDAVSDGDITTVPIDLHLEVI